MTLKTKRIYVPQMWKCTDLGEKAYVEGYRAFEIGMALADNPHEKQPGFMGNLAHNAWNSGWKKAEAVLA